MRIFYFVSERRGARTGAAALEFGAFFGNILSKFFNLCVAIPFKEMSRRTIGVFTLAALSCVAGFPAIAVAAHLNITVDCNDKTTWDQVGVDPAPVLTGDTITVTYLNCARIVVPPTKDGQDRYIMASFYPYNQGTTIFNAGANTDYTGQTVLNFVAVDIPSTGYTNFTLFSKQYISAESLFGTAGELGFKLKPNPTVTGISSSAANGHYRAGDTIQIAVTFSKAVTTTDATLTLDIGAGRTVAQSGGSGTNTIVFDYVVQAGDTVADLDYISTTALAGTIIDASDSAPAILTLPSPGATDSLGASKDIVIDTTPPVVTDTQMSVSGATGTNGTFKIGDVVTISWDPANGDGDAHLSGTQGGVTVDFTAFGGGSAVAASFVGAKWQATYTIVSPGSLSGENLAVSVTATDAANNSTTEPYTTTAVVDAEAPPTPPAPTFANDGSNTGSTLDAITRDDTPTLTGTGDANSIMVVYVDGTEVGEATVDASGNWSFTFAALDLDEGDNGVTVRNKDGAGNLSSASADFPVTLDTTATTVVVTSDVSALKADETATVTFSFSEQVVDFTADDVQVAGGTLTDLLQDPDDPTKYTATFTPDADFEGVLSATVTADSYTDVAGNDGKAGTTPEVAIDTLAPTVTFTGPTDVVVAPFTLTITFSEVTEGFTLDDLVIGAGTGTLGSFVETVPGKEWTVLVTPVLGQLVTVNIADGSAQDLAGNPSVMAPEYSVMAGSPEYEFDQRRDDIRSLVREEALAQLAASMRASERMMSDARERVIAETMYRQGASDGSDPANGPVPFDVDATVASASDAGGLILATQGAFVGQTGFSDGVNYRLFGNFDVVAASDDRTLAAIDIRLAREQMVNDSLMLGSYIGGDFSQSSIDGSYGFDGSQTGWKLSAGGYFVAKISRGLFLDGFGSVGYGKNDLAISTALQNDHVLDLKSDYATRTWQIGSALTGVFDFDGTEFRPNVMATYGNTDMGTINFDARAYGLFDQVALDAGIVEMGIIRFTPELRFGLNGLAASQSAATFSLMPTLACEYRVGADTRTECGAGGGLRLSGSFWGQRAQLAISLDYERIGSQTRSGGYAALSLRF